MITASHNPRQDNGYKVYWDNGCQIISPHDKAIARSIIENQEPWSWDLGMVDRSPLCIDPFADLWEDYFSSLINHLSFHRQVVGMAFSHWC
jgi:phosphoglucomutase / phosphopentomutase